MKRHDLVPSTVGPLEARVALSHVGAVPHPIVPTEVLNLSGLVGGLYRKTGSVYRADGTTTISPLGQVQFVTQVRVHGGPHFVGRHEAGFNRPQTIAGSLQLSNAQGLLTLRLSGRTDPSSGRSTEAYTIVSGSGVYGNVTGSGRVIFDVGGPAMLRGRFFIDLGNAPPPP